MSKPIVAAIGTFDGVHRGHRSVITALTEYAKQHEMDPLVITFSRHPLQLIDPERSPAMLTTLAKKKKLLTEAGAQVKVVDFDESLRATTARQWMQYLYNDWNVRALVIGYDNTFGSDGVNLSLEDYRKIGEEIGLKVITVDEIKGVSSSAIRKAVKSGNMELACEMLGRPYSITGKVIHGQQIGQNLGFPTANVEIPEGVAIPKPGAYSAVVKILDDGSKYPAMVNVGTRPTLMRGNDLQIEAHLLDFSGNLYDKEITVRFLSRLRDETKFDSIEALKAQLETDRNNCRNILKPNTI